MTASDNTVVVLGNPQEDDGVLLQKIQDQLADRFGDEVRRRQHLETYRILHALPDQSPPTRNPTCPESQVRPGGFICGEHGSLPGIQWALLSGRRAADAVQAQLRDQRSL